MAAASVILNLITATHGTAIAGATHAKVSLATKMKIDQGDGAAPGPADACITDRDLVVEVYGTNFSALLAKIGVAAANLVLAVATGGANGSVTLKNIYFGEAITAVEIPEKDGGGKLAPFGIRGYGNFSAGDTFASMIS